MKIFQRGLRPAALNALKELAESSTPNWWTDLLAHWAPSGPTNGKRRLRLAVRDNYLNFYLNGQSVARVAFDAQSQPRIEVHVKYAFENATEQAYVKFTDTEVRNPSDGSSYVYANGGATVREWMARASEWETAEKKEVERLVADNPGVIDLEMALPAHGEQVSALRMDLVALEPAPDGVRIVFWEAKRITDARLKSQLAPEVLSQIRCYQDYLNNPGHRSTVIDAYRRTSQTLLTLGQMAEQSKDEKLYFSPLITLAAQESTQITVDETPRLVIFGTEDQLAGDTWKIHESKLRGYGLPLQLLKTDAYRLTNPNPVTGILE